MGTVLKHNLVGQLCKFGLNPSDWQLEQDTTQDNQYLLVNRQDPDFQMRGSVDWNSNLENPVSWGELSISSI